MIHNKEKKEKETATETDKYNTIICLAQSNCCIPRRYSILITVHMVEKIIYIYSFCLIQVIYSGGKNAPFR